MATSEIGYSEVDANLQAELIARAAAGKKNRRNVDINYMVSKIANVTLTPYDTPEKTKPIIEAQLGGVGAATGEYLPTGPNGFLSDRSFKISDSSVNTNGIGDGKPTVSSKTNTSKRIPPYLTGIDVQIGDDSMGVMQTATINITIPNPGRDLNYFESVYMRPGRAVNIIIDHPTTAIITEPETAGLLTSGSMPSTEKLKELYPNLTPDEQRKYQKMNSFIFDGLITSFTLDYQQDASVAASLTIRGTTQVYTDISMIMADVGKKDDTNVFGVSPPPSQIQADADAAAGALADAEKSAAAAKEAGAQRLSHIKALKQAKAYKKQVQERISGYNASRTVRNSESPVSNTQAAKDAADIASGKKPYPARKLGFADKIIDAIKEQKKKKEELEPGSNKTSGVYIDKSGGNNTDRSFIWGSPGLIEDYKDYISLKALIEFINDLILLKLNNVTGVSTKIIMDSEISAGKYYPELRSADPENVFFPGQDNYGGKTWYHNLDLLGIKPKFVDYSLAAAKLLGTLPSNFSGETITTKSTLIYISLKFIQSAIFDVLDADNGTVSDFMKKISSKIYYASGGAYQMSLVTHPEQQNALLYYDTNNVKGFSDVPEAFSIPMFANHPAGTVVKDFQFNGKLPTDASTLAYVLNQDPAEISESDIAPFLSYMYSANTVTRSGRDEAIGNIITDETLLKIEADYKKRHTDYKDELDIALGNYGKDVNDDTQKALHTSIKNYIQYPTETIRDTNQFKAPVIPFDVSFTIEGINGFRYGDVLQFEGLPDRYTNNTVFSIISINHSVDSAGEWNTEIRCIMRPKID